MIDTPLIISLKVEESEKRGPYHCEWWDIPSKKISERGCKAKSYSKGILKCECNHLTSFMATFSHIGESSQIDTKNTDKGKPSHKGKGESPQNISDSTPFYPAGIAW